MLLIHVMQSVGINTEHINSLSYKDHKDKDGFLYVKYDIESTFG